jgi:Domain of unknown function (DUF4440)
MSRLSHQIVALAFAGVFLLPNPVYAANLKPRAEAEKYITKSESEWAEQSVTNDDAVLRRLIADDYTGISSGNVLGGKAEMIAAALEAQKSPSKMVSNKVTNMKVHFYSDHLAVAQGSESWVRTDGTRGRNIWTDTWLERGGKWQIIASQDTRLPPAE